MTPPDLPRFSLAHGPWRAEVFDPRPDPFALGARYVHGGYVAALDHNGRRLTGMASETWDPYVGVGLPEVFEWPLGFAHATQGDELLRVGAGRLIRTNPRGIPGSGGLPTTPVTWSLLEHGPNVVDMETEDHLRYGDVSYAYRLRRSVRLDDGGLISTTTLTASLPWNHPVAWFAHPFFAHTAGDRTGFELPPGSQPMPPVADDRPDARLPQEGGLINVTGLWGCRDPIGVQLDPALGGGRLRIRLDRPLDHLVIYASPHAASPEPQLSRTWKNGETASWSIRYGGFTP